MPLGESAGLISCRSACLPAGSGGGCFFAEARSEAIALSICHLARACPLRAQGDVKLEGEFVTQPLRKDGRAAPGCFRCGIGFCKE